MQKVYYVKDNAAIHDIANLQTEVDIEVTSEKPENGYQLETVLTVSAVDKTNGTLSMMSVTEFEGSVFADDETETEKEITPIRVSVITAHGPLNPEGCLDTEEAPVTFSVKNKALLGTLLADVKKFLSETVGIDVDSGGVGFEISTIEATNGDEESGVNNFITIWVDATITPEAAETAFAQEPVAETLLKGDMTFAIADIVATFNVNPVVDGLISNLKQSGMTPMDVHILEAKIRNAVHDTVNSVNPSALKSLMGVVVEAEPVAEEGQQ